MVNRKTRIENALWGLFIADSLAMPAHWYYSRENIARDFNGGVKTYEAPLHPHPEAFMVGMSYLPDIEKANMLGRPYDILHEHSRFYKTSWAELEIKRTEREGEHGNAVAAEDERYHYHHGLGQGDNTLNAHLARVLLRSINKRGGYEAGAFLDEFIEHMTTPGVNKDPYTEVFLRRWFENYCAGDPVHACAQMQRDNWSIGSHGGMIRPMILSLLSQNAYQGIGMALEHQVLTHRSETIASGLAVCVPLLFELVNGVDAKLAFQASARQVHMAAIRGEDLFAQYRDHKGPGNIPDDKMWAYHMDLAGEPMNLSKLVEMGEQNVLRREIGTVCYIEQGLPMMFFIAEYEDYNFEKAMLLNVNAGGDNVNRGMPLGLMMGAASEKVPDRLKRGLSDYETLSSEISNFAEIAVSGQGVTTGFEAPSRRAKT
ncbi:ADP-ribosylglycohydrolase family protein [Lentilitoribacter sp. EG35]|uniref:ADP-ribosylglycohydrolase family protein n=1 Tax=Lentilitoribacter sp. EG35 TaxID=3234192 RepID=UPI00345FC5F2